MAPFLSFESSVSRRPVKGASSIYIRIISPAICYNPIHSFIHFVSPRLIFFSHPSDQIHIFFLNEKMVMEISSLDDNMVLKVAMFLLVQVLVYLILSNSSGIFSKNAKRSLSFRPARSVSINRILAVLSDMPAGGELSPAASTTLRSPNQAKSRPRDLSS